MPVPSQILMFDNGTVSTLIVPQECELECGQPAYRYGLCRDCEHPDDSEFYDYDPGEEF